MASRGTSLAHLCNCFQGSLPPNIDWTSVISLANETLTTTALQDVTEQFPDRIPPDVSRYVGELFARNLVRNDRLAEQLTEVLQALNADGITPVLVKGSALLATSPRMKMGRRLVSDLDLLVSFEECQPAFDCLRRLGYRVDARSAEGAPKWYADLARPGDVGTIDLQHGPPGHRFFYSALGDLKQHCRLLEQGTAYVPTATCQALMLIIHDQFQDADYWVGQIDLRHLLDLRDLAAAPDGIDWSALASIVPGKLARNAVETQLLTLNSLLNVDVPLGMRTRLVPRLQHWRRTLQTDRPGLRHILFSMVLLDYGNYRVEAGFEARREKSPADANRIWPRMDTLRFLLNVSGDRRNGKV